MNETPMEIDQSVTETLMRSAQKGLPLKKELLPKVISELKCRVILVDESASDVIEINKVTVDLTGSVYNKGDTLMLNTMSECTDISHCNPLDFTKTRIDAHTYNTYIKQVSGDNRVVPQQATDCAVCDIPTYADSKDLSEIQMLSGVGLKKLTPYTCNQLYALLKAYIDMFLEQDDYDVMLAKQIQICIIHLALMLDTVRQHNLRIYEVYTNVVYQLWCVKTITCQLGIVLFAAPSVEWLNAVVSVRAINMFDLIAPTDFIGYNNYTPLIAPHAVEKCSMYAQPIY